MLIVISSGIDPPADLIFKKPFGIGFKSKVTQYIDNKHVEDEKKNNERVSRNREDNKGKNQGF